MIMRRLLFSTGNIFLSLVLGAIAFGFVFLKYPDTMNQILDAASGLKTWLITRGLSPEYNNWIRVLLGAAACLHGLHGRRADRSIDRNRHPYLDLGHRARKLTS